MTMEQVKATETFSSVEVSKITGATYRQLDYWCRSGLIPGQAGVAPGSGARRRWTAADVQRARLVKLAAMLSHSPLDKTVAMLEHELMLQRFQLEVHELVGPHPVGAA